MTTNNHDDLILRSDAIKAFTKPIDNYIAMTNVQIITSLPSAGELSIDDKLTLATKACDSLKAISDNLAARSSDKGEAVGEVRDTGEPHGRYIHLFKTAYQMEVGDKLFTAPQQAIPAGYAIVPIEPTWEMIAAPFAGKVEDQDMMAQKRRREAMADNYKAMVAAAPTAPIDNVREYALEEAAKIAEKFEPDEKQDYINYASKEIRKLITDTQASDNGLYDDSKTEGGG
jgi:hypothetical protein